MKEFVYVLNVLYYEVQFIENILITPEISRLLYNMTVH
jgi:hypothetical protein